MTVQNFNLNGADCPARSSANVLLEDGGNGRATLRIQFSASGSGVSVDPTSAPAPTAPMGAIGATGSTMNTAFQASGANDQSTCTVAVQLAAGPGAPARGVDFSIVGAIATVRSTSSAQGQLSVRSQFRVNNANSQAVTAQIPRAAAAAGAMAGQPQDVTLNNVAVRAGAARQIALLANTQLQNRNAGNDARLTLDELKLDVRVRGEMANDPDGD